MTTHYPSQPREDFTTSEGLRALLRRLHHSGTHAWKHDRVAADLAVFAAEKYAALARKHGLDPWEAASAAFDVMRTRSARDADDPWAVVTRGVQVTSRFSSETTTLPSKMPRPSCRRSHLAMSGTFEFSAPAGPSA